MTLKNIAVIGAGYWGRNLVRNFHELGVLKTICDGAQTVRDEMARTYPEAAVTAAVTDVLADPAVTGVVIAAPAALHFELATAALQAGKHVFVEKPLALTRADGAALVQLAAQCRRTLFVGHILHYHAAVIRLKELIRAGVIGRLQYIYSRRLSFGKIRREENILWSFAPHDISLILSLTGEEPSYVDAVGSNFLHARIADVTMTNLKFPSGIGAHIFVSWLNPYKEQKLVVVGSEGMLVFDDTEPIATKLMHYPHKINWQNNLPVPHKGESEPVDIAPLWKEPLKAECEAFLTAVGSGVPPLTSGEEGLRVLKILEISQASLEEKERGGGMAPRAHSAAPETVYVAPRERAWSDAAAGAALKPAAAAAPVAAVASASAPVSAGAALKPAAAAGAAVVAGAAPSSAAPVAAVASASAPAYAAVASAPAYAAAATAASAAVPVAAAPLTPAAPIAPIPVAASAPVSASAPAAGALDSSRPPADIFIHPTAVVDAGVAIGKGTKIWHFSHILSGSTVGEGCNIGQNVVIGPDVAVGARCKIQNNVSVYKGVTLEEGVFCGPAMVFTNIYNPRAEIPKMDQVRPTIVRRGATLGANCTIVCGVTIGRYAFVGAGAVVTRDVPDHALVVGNPARRIGYMCECGERLRDNGERLTDNRECPACGKIYPRLSDA